MGYLIRIVIAVVAVLLAYAIIPLFASVVGFPLRGDVWQLLRYVIAGLAVFYVILGPTPNWRRPPPA